ncbi:MAG TPA: tRNA (adenosine(37)-N6)-threonylcarbamoyltransferase complex dimerization subunit type 1 TsaB [Rhodoglobus sp.]|nr:tRNA (adenosine(37)-N6)-threonylcarbamoyltransferase complex dimerization subunit type 1 TsaB [Rhodoglobus sp.]
MLLAIDTSAGTSVALVDPESGIVAQADSDDPRGHAERIGSFIERVLDGGPVLTGVVVGMGPGPFTGLRVGIAAARAFAFGRGVPVLPLVSHDALAWGIEEPVLVTTDARRREVFWSAYDGLDADRIPVRVEGPSLAKALAPSARRRIDALSVSAGDLGLLAAALLRAGRPFAADEPLYLRSPDVTPSAGPKRVTG